MYTAGRLIVVLVSGGSREPSKSIGDTGLNAAPCVACDVEHMKAGEAVVLDEHCATFPQATIGAISAGEYTVQAVFRCNPDLRTTDAPGTLLSEPQKIAFDPGSAEPIRLTLSMMLPEEALPSDGELLKFVKIESKLLSEFWKRPIFLRAGVILPKGFAEEKDRKYPLWVNIGGYGQRFRSAKRMIESPFSPLRAAWLADDAPRMVLLQLDGAGPLGDPYQVNSDNHGPYGDAVVKELIPYIEAKFRCIGEPRARFLAGHSTGGWVSLALQVFYPDFFNGCWSSSPDGVDFRGFQLINVYDDENAYVNGFGFERPAKRTLAGDVEYTVRHECQMENLLGDGNSWTMSGGQWGAWNATYGPRGGDGRPVPLWDPVSGEMNRSVGEHWEKYDLRKVLEANWKELGPKLRGKLHIMVGDADDYFLNVGVGHLERFLSKAEPAYEGWIKYGRNEGHGYCPLTDLEMMRQMAERVETKKD